MWDWVSNLIEPVMKPINTWQERKNIQEENKQKIKQANHDLEMTIIKHKTQLAMNKESHNQSWELESLKSNKSKSMQWIILVILIAPFIIAWFNPALVALYFTKSLATIPVWFQQIFISVVGVIWGVSQLKNVADGIGDTFRKSKSIDVSKVLEIDGSKIIRPDEYFNKLKKSITDTKEDLVEDYINETEDLL